MKVGVDRRRELPWEVEDVGRAIALGRRELAFRAEALELFVQQNKLILSGLVLVSKRSVDGTTGMIMQYSLVWKMDQNRGHDEAKDVLTL